MAELRACCQGEEEMASPGASVRGLQRRSDPEGSELTNGLVPYWINNMMALLGGGKG